MRFLAATATVGRSASFIEFKTPPERGVRSRRVNAPFFFPPAPPTGVEAESTAEAPVDDCRGKDSSALTPDDGSANGLSAPAEASLARDGADAGFASDDAAEPAGPGPGPAGLLPDPCFTTAGFAMTPPPPGPGPDPASGVAASRKLDPSILPLTGVTSETAPYHDVRWNPALVDAARDDSRAVRAAEASREPGVPGVPAPAAGRDCAATEASGGPVTLELVRPPVAVPALAVAGVSTARV